MPIVEATPYGDDGKPYLSEDGKGETAQIPELKAGARYIYYRLYTKDGPLESNNPIYSNDRSISRISSKLVRPPHTAALLKKYLCKIEGLGTFEECSLYQSLSEQTALENSTRLSFRGTPGPGLSVSDPMALVVDASTAKKRSQTASTGDPPKLIERDYELRYVHYFIYDEDGGVVSKASFDENTTSLGRVNTLSIPPPHTVSSLKYHLIKSEEIMGHNVQLFGDEDDEFPMEDSDPISILADTFPGFLEDRPIAIAYESQGIGSTTSEDPNEILAQDPQKARSAFEELQKSNEMLVHELAKLRQESKGAKDTYARELREAKSALDRLKQEKVIIEAVLGLGGSAAQIKAVLERPSFTKKLKVLKDNSSCDDDPTWHPLKAGDILFTDGIFKLVKRRNNEWGCYLGISSTGKLALIANLHITFC